MDANEKSYRLRFRLLSIYLVIRRDVELVKWKADNGTAVRRKQKRINWICIDEEVCRNVKRTSILRKTFSCESSFDASGFMKGTERKREREQKGELMRLVKICQVTHRQFRFFTQVNALLPYHHVGNRNVTS